MSVNEWIGIGLAAATLLGATLGVRRWVKGKPPASQSEWDKIREKHK